MSAIPQALAAAVRHHQAGEFARAEQLYRQILQANPADANALHLLGMLAFQVGKHQAALDLIGRAIAAQPQVAEFHCNLAGVYRALNQLDRAVACCRQAQRLRPDLPEIHAALGEILEQRGSLEEALAGYREAVRLRPAYVAAHNGMGNALRLLGRLEEAEASYRQAVLLEPGNADLLYNLGATLTQLGRLVDAEGPFREAVRLRPEVAENHYFLGMVLNGLHQRDEARVCFEQAVRLRPDHVGALNELAGAYQKLRRMKESLALLRRAAACDPQSRMTQDNYLLALLYHPDANAEMLYTEHQRWGAAFDALPRLVHRASDRDPHRRLRIGYVSPDFREHGMGRYSEAVIQAHDRGLFEIYCYANVHAPDARTERMKMSADHWRLITRMADAEAAALIVQDQIDILVDLAGHTGGNRLGVFTHKPAPIQVTQGGNASTTGLRAMDYRITDALHDPPGWSERWHTEKLARLPRVQMCLVPLAPAEVGPLPAGQSGSITFGCLNNLIKVTDRMIGLWSKILLAVPGSKLLMLTGEGTAADDSVRGTFARHAIGPERLILVGSQPAEAYLRRYHELDICLDTYPFNGLFTSFDALWMGVPLVSLAGRMSAARQGLALLTQVDLEDLVTEEPEEYVAIAVRLARDLPRLEKTRSGLRERVECTLGNVNRFTRELEGAYRGMWRQYLKVEKEEKD